MIRLDASAANALERIAAMNAPSIADLTPRAARLQFDAGYGASQLKQEDVAHTAEDNWGGLRVRIWRGHGAEPNCRALLYLHGGGWVIGGIGSHEDICQRIANRAGAVVVSPEYRLAPETPFPGAIGDCVTVLSHLRRNAAALDVDPARIAVGGDSAGGNLAAVLALLARDGEAPDIAAQLLIYPNTDQAQNSESFQRFGEGCGLTAREMAWFRGHYLRTEADRHDWRAAPLNVASLNGVAPAAVILAGHDVLYSEGAAYAARLTDEGRAAVRCWPGQIHGFLSMSALIPEAVEAAHWLCDTWLDIAP